METFRLTEIGEKEWESYNNSGFKPGLLITEEDLKKIRIPLVVGCAEYRVFRSNYSGWLLMGRFDKDYRILTSLGHFQLENILGEYFEEEYYERILS